MMSMKSVYTLIIIMLAYLFTTDTLYAERLESPKLKVKEPSFAEMSSASVTWLPVPNATGYEVIMNGQPIEVVGNTLYLSGKNGKHTISIKALAEGFEDSLPSVTSITVRDYGDGTEANPYRIYTKEDWGTFAAALTRNLFANDGFRGEYVALGADIDFEGTRIVPVAKNFATAFQGTFDGQGYMLSNAILDGSQSMGLFVSLRGIVKNLKVNAIKVKSSVKGSNDGRSAVLCGGETSGQLYNCIVMNSSVEVTGDNAGAYGAAIVSVLNSPLALVDRCIATNNRIKVDNHTASAVVARFVSGTVRNCVAQNNEIYSGCKFAAGIAGSVCGQQAVLDHCLSSCNKITSRLLYSAGVAAEISAGLTVNCISDSNVIVVEQMRCAGGIAGLIRKEGNLVNCLSKACVLNVKETKEPYIGLVFSLAEKDWKGMIANCVVLSGVADVSTDATGFMGIIGGSISELYRCSECYYSDALITEYNKNQSGRFYGFGLPRSRGNNHDCAYPVRKSSMESMSSDSILNRLNAGAYRYSSYGATRWILGADGLPMIN